MGEKVIRIPHEDMPAFIRIANRYLGEDIEVRDGWKGGEEKPVPMMNEADAPKLRSVKNKVLWAWKRKEHSSLPYASIFLTEEELELMRGYMDMLGETDRLGPIDVKRFE